MSPAFFSYSSCSERIELHATLATSTCANVCISHRLQTQTASNNNETYAQMNNTRVDLQHTSEIHPNQVTKRIHRQSNQLYCSKCAHRIRSDLTICIYNQVAQRKAPKLLSSSIQAHHFAHVPQFWGHRRQDEKVYTMPSSHPQFVVRRACGAYLLFISLIFAHYAIFVMR